ncbi:ARM repeat-containing protein [Polychaeton citri CBS 116435]|uniref:ARM repeat-containing protein n=1 Tax=Polychaeton citri CBS 116435 TaxID=1314669 RepID=A0A9P4QEP6_9PEZI|nr:ARM repeat-containing protein [Polychaeton citri CBS 116435]
MASFAIEVPGEANPLTETLVVHSLRAASSNEPYQIQAGTKQLQQWERSTGFYVHLQNTYFDTRLPIEIRYLAVIQLKNGIDKYWRKTATNAVSKDDKNIIRSRLLQGSLDEVDNRLALQNAITYARIARHDFPNDMPDAINILVSEVRRVGNEASLRLLRALQMLLQVVKELSTGRLLKSRQSLQAATPEIVAVLGQLYVSSMSKGLGDLSSSNEPLTIGLLAIKTMRRLLISGYEHPNRSNEVIEFWIFSIQRLAELLRMPASSPPLVGKHKLQLGKLHHEMARDHPASFALLPDSMELAKAYWGLIKDFGQNFGSKEAVTKAVASARIGTDGDAGAEDPSSQEKLVLRGLLTIRACVKMVHNPTQTFKYRRPEDKAEREQATKIVQSNLLTTELVQDVMEITITKFFVFREADLREWEEEPEEWEKREEGDGDDWEFSIRPCSEKLFLDLAINYKDIILQPFIALFSSVASLDNEDVLFKDSIYTAMGLSAPVVADQLDFDEFLRTVLVPEVQKQKPGFNILRRRAAILLGQWITINVTERQLVYQVFQHLLDASDSLNDEVVRVTAGRQLAKIADDWEFKAPDFLPFAETTLDRMMHLIEEVELSETKMALLNTISVIVERLDHHITPFAERIIGLLPPLWEQSGEEHLMKQAILTILSRLTNAMKSSSVPFHGLMLPIIKGAVEPGSDTQIYLLDDALDLWGAILVQTPAGEASQDLLSLAQYLFSIFELGSENLRKALEMTESYILLAPEYMLSERHAFFRAFASLLGTLRPDANGLVCNLLEIMTRSIEKIGGYEAATQTCVDMLETGAMGKLIEGLYGAWRAHCTTGPLAERPPVDGIVETDYFAVIARVVLGSTDGACQAIQRASAAVTGADSGIEGTMKWLIEEWVSHFENMGDPGRRKLMCLALTKLLETHQPFILLNLQSLMTLWTDVIIELREDATNPEGDSLIIVDAQTLLPEHDSPEAPEDIRRREMTLLDRVHSVALPSNVKFHLQEAIHAVGGEAKFREDWLVNVDQDILKAFGDLGIM